MSAATNPLFPGDQAQGEAVRAHREAMETLNPAPAPVTGTPAKTDDGDKGSAKNSSRLPKNWKRIPDSELKGMTKKLGSAPVYDKGGKVNVADGKHQVAILKDGERVLTEKQNEEYEKKNCVQCFDKGGVVHSPEEKAQFHRSMSHLNTGGLHRHFGIPEGHPIPLAKKQEAANSDDPHVSKMGHLAVSMHGWAGQKGSKKK